MGRPPVGKVAMSDAERHRRYMARLRQRAAKGAAAAPATRPAGPDGPTILAALRYLAMNPVLTAKAMRGIIGDQATREFRDALTQELGKAAMADADPAVDEPEHDE